MGYINNHYYTDNYGNLRDSGEVIRAASNNDLTELSNGRYWDRETGDEYWADGTKY